MTELAHTFTQLGIEQYLEAFIDEGFESRETVMDITESDL
jgi:hypothetical protein